MRPYAPSEGDCVRFLAIETSAQAMKKAANQGGLAS
jgi:hypothetical protein